MGRVLVVYFSRTGHTRRVAEEIARQLGADTEAIEEPRSRAGLFGYIRSAREAVKQQGAAITAPRKDPRDYELVILGTPVWAGNLSSPVRAYLAAQRAKLPQVAFFCTQNGSGAAKVLRQMADLCERAPLAELTVRAAELRRRQHTAKLNGFLDGVRFEPRADGDRYAHPA